MRYLDELGGRTHRGGPSLPRVTRCVAVAAGVTDAQREHLRERASDLLDGGQ